jgi:hypothetical protein
MLIDEQSKKIPGFTAFVTGAGDLIAVVQTAMLSEVRFPSLSDAIFTRPAMAEGLTALLADVEVRQNDGAQQAMSSGFGLARQRRVLRAKSIRAETGIS